MSWIQAVCWMMRYRTYYRIFNLVWMICILHFTISPRIHDICSLMNGCKHKFTSIFSSPHFFHVFLSLQLQKPQIVCDYQNWSYHRWNIAARMLSWSVSMSWITEAFIIDTTWIKATTVEGNTEAIICTYIMRTTTKKFCTRLSGTKMVSRISWNQYLLETLKFLPSE